MRRELKYVVPDEAVPFLRDAILPFTVPDIYCLGYEGRGYTVRSIYLDSPTLRYYYEKQAHLSDRKKLRIRGYNEPNAAGIVFLEIKRRMNLGISKDRLQIEYSKVEEMLDSGRLEADSAEGVSTARNFIYHVRLDHLLPTSLVAYEREAFQGRFDRTFRVTLDHNLRGALYPGLEGLYREEGFRDAMPGFSILEVKYTGRFPAWMRTVIARFELIQRSASKYCMCLDLFESRSKTKSAVLAARCGQRMDEQGSAHRDEVPLTTANA